MLVHAERRNKRVPFQSYTCDYGPTGAGGSSGQSEVGLQTFQFRHAEEEDKQDDLIGPHSSCRGGDIKDQLCLPDEAQPSKAGVAPQTCPLVDVHCVVCPQDARGDQ